MLYNELRFNNPFEFGEHYQLAGDRQDTIRHFSPHFFWFNFCVYFLEPVRWSRHFPFVGDIGTPALPPGHAPIEDPFGVLANIPILWLALAAPLAWRGRVAEARSALRGFLAAVALCFGASALVLCLFYGTCSRYEVEFLPALVLLAVVGVFGVERAMAGRPRWRLACRVVWGLLLVFSIGFNLLGAANRHATQRCLLGNKLIRRDGSRRQSRSMRWRCGSGRPMRRRYSDLGNALRQAGRIPEAIEQCRTALRLDPDYAKAHNNLGNALLDAGQVPAAIAQYQAALQQEPDDPTAHYNLGIALFRAERLPEAIAQYETAVRLQPDEAEAHYNLGNALLQVERVPEAIEHYQTAVRLAPDFLEAYNNLGSALLQAGQTPEAIEEFETALRLKPDYAEGHNNLGNAFYQAGRIRDAIREYAAAVRLKPDYLAARRNLERMLKLLPADDQAPAEDGTAPTMSRKLPDS